MKREPKANILRLQGRRRTLFIRLMFTMGIYQSDEFGACCVCVSDRRRNHQEEETPEWFTGGPTSQADTIELRGFEREGEKSKKTQREEEEYEEIEVEEEAEVEGQVNEYSKDEKLRPTPVDGTGDAKKESSGIVLVRSTV